MIEYIAAIASIARAKAPDKDDGIKKVTDWNGTKGFLPEANGFVTAVRGHGRVCYFYLQFMSDQNTPIGSPTLLWCESDTKYAESRSPK